jgi:general secretion pathway protein D
VLGGLLEDVLRESDQRVPILGSIPLIGNLFRARKTEKVKTNLMIFIRAEILRNASDAALETNSKYNFIRDVQQGNLDNDVALMPGTARPVLPLLDESQIQREQPPASEDSQADGSE